MALAPGVAVGQVDGYAAGHPGIDISVPDNEVRPGEETALSVVVFNDGTVTDKSPSNPQLEQQVMTARAMRVRIEDDHDAPVSVNTNEQFVSRLPDGGSAPLQFAVTVDGDADPGEYRLPVNVSYNYTAEIDPRTGEENRTTVNRTLNATLVVTETAQFEVVDVESNVQVGATGTVDVTLENTGHERARNASVALTSENGELTVGGALSGSRYVDGAWNPGERRTMSYEVSAARSASQQRYSFTADVRYENAEGNARQSEPLSLGVVPDPEQTFSLTETNHSVDVGEEGTVTVTLRNDGPRTVRNASVALTSENGELTVGGAPSGSRYVDGTWEPGERRTISYDVSAARSAGQQQYAFSAEVRYENVEGTTRRSNPLSLGVVPGPEQTFALARINHSVEVDDEGTVTVTLRNDGPRTVQDASVRLQSSSADVVFGESASASEFVGRWAPGESRTVEVNATALPDAEVRNYTVRATVDYDDRDGNPSESRPVAFGLRPGPEREYEFSAGEFESDLRVGEEGTLSGTVTNTGDRVAHNVVVVFETRSETVSPIEREYPVGTLAPGESGAVEFDVDVGGSAEAGPQQFTLRPRYRNSDDERREAESFDVRAAIGPERDVFAVDITDATVPRGDSTTLEVTVRNDAGETMTDISAQLFADSPVSVVDDEAFVGRLEAGEETTIQFEIGASGAALIKTYPIEMDFQYDDSDGDTQLSDTYRAPVEVTEPEDDGGVPTSVVVGVAVLLVLLVGVVAYRRFG